MGGIRDRAGVVTRYLEEIGASFLSGEDLVAALARRAPGETLDVDGVPLQPDLLHLVPESLSFENRILPIHRTDGILFVAVPPGRIPEEGIGELEHLLGMMVETIAVAELDVLGILVKAHQLLRRHGASEGSLRPAGRATPGGGPIALSELGIPQEILSRLTRALAEPQGLILLSGPARAGKTTTLRAAIDQLRHRHQQVAYLDGSRGLEALEEELEDDPDVVALDDTRSPSTAARAVRAAVEGRKILLAVEAPDAAGAVARLTDLKVDPYLIGNSLRAGLNQRLLRRVCVECCEEYREPTAVLEDVRLEKLLREISLRRGRGCRGCQGTGYQGRVAVFEYGDRGAGRSLRTGFRPLVADALGKVLRGETTLEEMLEQVPFTQVLQASDRLDVRRITP